MRTVCCHLRLSIEDTALGIVKKKKKAKLALQSDGNVEPTTVKRDEILEMGKAERRVFGAKNKCM